MTSSTQATSTTPKVAINDIGSEEAFLACTIERPTIKYFNDGDSIVEGTVVKVDRDEVFAFDIGYKTEGVIPSRARTVVS